MGRKTSNNELRPEKVQQLRLIFEEKGWPIGAEPDVNVFDDFCKMLTSLHEAQQDFVLQLTKSFLWVRESDYRRLFYEAFDRFVKQEVSRRKKRIVIVPLVAPKDLGKQKSSQFLFYQVEANFNKRKYKSYSIIFADNYDVLSAKIREDDYICLIDDFLGSGGQATEAVEHIEQTMELKREQIAVITLITQNIGYQRCVSQKIKVFFAEWRERGITDNPDMNADNIASMREIEEIVMPPSGYSFGKGRTEALVKMVRTPNNTFPVYWYSNSQKFPTVPFPRRPV